jgi:hypothetical protein
MVFLGRSPCHHVVPNGTFGEEASGFSPKTKDGMACREPCRPPARPAKEDPGRNSQRKAGAPRPHQIGGTDTRYCRRNWNNRGLPLTCGPSAGGLYHGRIMGGPPKGSKGFVAWPVGEWISTSTGQDSPMPREKQRGEDYIVWCSCWLGAED